MNNTAIDGLLRWTGDTWHASGVRCTYLVWKDERDRYAVAKARLGHRRIITRCDSLDEAQAEAERLVRAECQS